MRSATKATLAALVLVAAGSAAAQAQSDTCEGVVTINGIMTSARTDGSFAYTLYVQNHQPRRIVVSFVTGNFPANVTLDMPIIQNFVMNANFATGFRLGTGRSNDINSRTVAVIYRGTSSRPYIRLQDCRPY